VNHEKRILITGASRGIGKAIALHMANQGFITTVHYHSREDLACEVVEQIQQAGGQADTLQFDVSDGISTQAALEHYVEEKGAFFVVFCNAGITRDAAFPAMTVEQWGNVIHTNLDAFYNVLKPLIMPMIRLRNGGRIVTLSSVSGMVGNRGQVNYSAAKAGIIGATKALSVELAKRKITVNCVAPGVIETDMINEAYKDEMIKAIPMNQLGRPEDIAKTVGFLFSEGAGYITRQVISVNGGLC